MFVGGDWGGGERDFGGGGDFEAYGFVGVLDDTNADVGFS